MAELDPKRALCDSEGLSDNNALNAIHELLCCVQADIGGSEIDLSTLEASLQALCDKFEAFVVPEGFQPVPIEFCDPNTGVKVGTKIIWFAESDFTTPAGETFLDANGLVVPALPADAIPCDTESGLKITEKLCAKGAL